MLAPFLVCARKVERAGRDRNSVDQDDPVAADRTLPTAIDMTERVAAPALAPPAAKAEGDVDSAPEAARPSSTDYPGTASSSRDRRKYRCRGRRDNYANGDSRCGEPPPPASFPRV